MLIGVKYRRIFLRVEPVGLYFDEPGGKRFIIQPKFFQPFSVIERKLQDERALDNVQ